MAKLKKKFRFKNGDIEVSIVDWEDGTPLGYVWFGVRREVGQDPRHVLDLNAKQAIDVAKNILLAAKKAGYKV